MTTQAIPKLLFLNEESEELIDRRFNRQQQLIQQKDNKQVTQSWKYKFNSQIMLLEKYQIAQSAQQIDKETSIFNSAYSNIAGKVYYNCSQGIAMYTTLELQDMVKNKKLKRPMISFQERGSLFMSPLETKMAILNDKYIHICQLENKLSLSTSKSNDQGFTNICWQNQEILFLWSFQKQVYCYEILQDKLTKIQGVSKCTGINRLNQNIIIILQGITYHLYQQKTQTKSIDLGKKNPDTNYFQFMCLIGVQKLNGQSEKLSADDKYMLVGVYYTAYQEKDEQPCHRYAFFMKGDLYDEDTIQVRGNQLIMSMSDDEALYLQGENRQKKIPFSCIIQSCQNFLVVLVEKLPHVFFIDCTQNFQKLCIYTTWPKHGFKIPSQLKDKYMRGMAIMKNMLNFEKQPAAQDKISKLYCNKEFEGQFMRLYFSHKQTQLTIQFPLSVICFSDTYMFRKFAASTVNASQQQKQEQILKFVKKVGKSRYIKPIIEQQYFQQSQSSENNQSKKQKQAIKIINDQQSSMQISQISVKNDTVSMQSQHKSESIKKNQKQSMISQDLQMKSDYFKEQSMRQQNEQKKGSLQLQNISNSSSTPPFIPNNQTKKQTSMNGIFSNTGSQGASSKQLFGKNNFFNLQNQQLFKSNETKQDSDNQNKNTSAPFSGSSNPSGGWPLFNPMIKQPQTVNQPGTMPWLPINSSIIPEGVPKQAPPQPIAGSFNAGSLSNNNNPFNFNKKVEPVQQKKPPIDEKKSIFGGQDNFFNMPGKFTLNTNSNQIKPKTLTEMNKVIPPVSVASNTMTLPAGVSNIEQPKTANKSIFQNSSSESKFLFSGKPTLSNKIQHEEKPKIFGQSQSKPLLIPNQKISPALPPTQTPVPPSLFPSPSPSPSPSATATSATTASATATATVTAPPTPTTVPPAVKNTVAPNISLANKLQFFIQQKNRLQNVIEIYTQNKQKINTFSIPLAKNLIQQWNQTINLNQNMDETNMKDLVKKLDRLEKYQKFRINKTKVQSNQEYKQDVQNRITSISNQIVTICYFISFFQVKNPNKSSLFLPQNLMKPQLDPQSQKQKFIAILKKKLKTLEYEAEEINRRLKTDLIQKKQVKRQKKQSKKALKIYNFNNYDDSSSSLSSQDDGIQSQYSKILQKQKQHSSIKSTETNKFSVQDILQSLNQLELSLSYVTNQKQVFTFAPLEPVVEKQNSKLKMSPKNINNKQSHTGIKKPFDQKIAAKKQTKQTIPNLNIKQKVPFQQIIESEEGSDSETQVPQKAGRTISQIPTTFLPVKKQQQKKQIKATGNLFMNSKDNEKQKQEKPIMAANNLFANKQSTNNLIASFGIGQKAQQKKQDSQKQKQVQKQGEKAIGDFNSNSNGLSFGLFGAKTQTPITTSSTTQIQGLTPAQTPIQSQSQAATMNIFQNKKQQKLEDKKQQKINKQKQKQQKSAVPQTKPVMNMFSNKPVGNIFNTKPIQKQAQKQQQKKEKPAQQKIKPATVIQTVNSNPLSGFFLGKTQPATDESKENKQKNESASISANLDKNLNIDEQNKQQPKQSTPTVQPSINNQLKITVPLAKKQQENKVIPISSQQVSAPANSTNLSSLNTNATSTQVSSTATKTGNAFGQQGQTNLFTQSTQQNSSINAFNSESHKQNVMISNQSAQFQSHATTTFGGGNKFTLNSSSSEQQTGSFNPNQMKFGSSNQQSFKSFGSFGQFNNTTPFAKSNQSSQQNVPNQQPQQQQQQQPQGSWINSGQSNSWLNNNANQQGGSWLNQNQNQGQTQSQGMGMGMGMGMGQGQNQMPNWMNNNNNQQGMQGGMNFGQNNNFSQNQGQSANFMQNNNKFAGNKPFGSSAPPGINPMMMQPRK